MVWISNGTWEDMGGRHETSRMQACFRPFGKLVDETRREHFSLSSGALNDMRL